MELDELKEIWKNSEPSSQKADEQLKELLGKTSAGPIRRMKRNLLYELIAIIVSYSITIVYYFSAFQGKLIIIAWFMITIALSFFVYYYRKNKLLNEMECVTCMVKSNLEMQLKTLEKYIRFYLFSGMLVVPISMAIFAWIYYQGMTRFPITGWLDISTTGSPWKPALLWILASIILSVPIWFMNKWYLNKLYGKHIVHLKKILQEMSDD